VKHFLYVLLFLIANLLNAQSSLPWELERFKSSHYESPEMNLEITSDESEVFEEYFRVYKQKRTENPEVYFPVLTPYQRELKKYLTNTESLNDLLPLVNFLEVGNLEALDSLAASPYENKITLPYRFLAALSSGKDMKAAYLINEMDKEEMISPVLKSWGMNATSMANQKFFLTNGIQDLVGLTWALHKKDRLQNAVIFNRYINSITGRYVNEDEFLNEFRNAWISPAYEEAFLDSQLDNLSLCGIGFKLKTNNENAYTDFIAAATDFQGIGLPCQTPADEGLVRSYSYFNDQIYLLNRKNAAEEFQPLAEQLESYIKQTAKGK